MCRRLRAAEESAQPASGASGRALPPCHLSAKTSGSATLPLRENCRRLNLQKFSDALDQLLDVERFLDEFISARLEQVVDLVLIDHARHDDDLRVLERRV